MDCFDCIFIATNDLVYLIPIVSLISWFLYFWQHLLHEYSAWTLRKKCPYSELFWSVLSRIRTEYEEILRISSYSFQMRENTDQNKPEYGDF